MNPDRSSPSVAVIIPVFNDQENILNLLEALGKQTRVPDEIFIVNDGSTDETPENLARWMGDHPNLEVELLEQSHKGPGAARNRGAKHATSEILLFTDSDCVPAPDWVEKMVEPFADGQVVGVQGAYRTKQTELMARFAQIEIEDRYRRMKKDRWIDFIGTYSAAYRRSVFLENGCFDDRFPIASGEDADFSFRLAAKGLKMVFQADAVVYHCHPNTLWTYLKVKFWRAYWRNLLYRRHRSRIVKDSYTPHTLKFQTVLGLLFPVTLGAALVPDYGWIVPAGCLGGICILSLPFTVWVIRRDFLLGILTPGILFLRTFAFAGGAARGLLKGLWLNEDYL